MTLAQPPRPRPSQSAAEETRRLLVDAATRGFAEHGVHTASLLEITRQAGQRNRGAVHYHFGSRTGMLVAVLQQHRDFLAAREAELLALAEQSPDDDLEAVVRAFALPAIELGEQGWRGRSYLVILAELVEDDPQALDPDVRLALERSGGFEAFQLLERRLPPMPEELRVERLALTTTFILRSVADRGRTGSREAPGRAQLAVGPFTDNLVAMCVGMLGAPVPG